MTIVPSVTYYRQSSDPSWWYAPGRDPLPSFVPPGSMAIGTTSYDIPDTNVVYVSPFGNDSFSGAVDAPVRTLQHACDIAASTGTVVMRAGTYHEKVSWSKNLTIQNYPGETVWLDGTSTLGGFTNVGSGQWRAPYTVAFDRSPTTDRGADDNPTPGWGYINASFPYAAWPDQVWMDNIRLTQVGSLGELGPGKFYVQGTYTGGTTTPSVTGTNRYMFTGQYLYLGSDPSGKTVRVSDLNQAMTGTGVSTVRGIGIRRYAPSVCDFGMVRLYKEGSVMENCFVQESSTYGMSMIRANSTVRHVTVSNCGFTGIHGNQADNMLVEWSVMENNNSESFNQSPAAAGIKVTRMRHFTFRYNIVRGNNANGMWCDESVYDIKVYGNAFYSGGKHGVTLELCGTALVTNNIVYQNAGIGIYLNNVDHGRVWNNTCLENGSSDVNFNHDSRAPMLSGSTGRDPRQPFPDPDGMDWYIDSLEISNNVFSRTVSPAGSGGVVIRDSTNTRNGASFGAVMNGNVYNRRSGTDRMWGFPPAVAGGGTVGYFTLSSWQSATGQDANAVFVDGSSVLDSRFQSSAAGSPRPIPSDVAALTGHSNAQVGAWIGDFLWLS